MRNKHVRARRVLVQMVHFVTSMACNQVHLLRSEIFFFSSFNYDDDCLVYALIIIYESSLWCVQIIYDLFFKSFWQILIYVKRELQERKSDNHMTNCYGMKSFNTSRSNNYPLTGEKRMNHTLRIHNWSSLDIYHRSICSLQETNDGRQLVLTPVRSTYCQTEMELHTGNTTNAMHRPLTQPLIFMSQSSGVSLN